jgi:hypothetical protein
LSTNLFEPVFPPDAFALTEKAATFARVWPGERPGITVLRSHEYPVGSVVPGGHGSPIFSEAAFSGLVASARQAAGQKIRRACVTFPDSWARTLTLDFDVLPELRRDRTEMVNWKIKKLLPVRVEDLDITYSEIPKADGGSRLLVCAAPRESLRSIEEGFAACGIRVGSLTPATVALFNGLDPRLSKAAGGDYLLLHRSPGASCLLIARGGKPLFFRQKPESEGREEDLQEIRLSLSYYSENLGGGNLSAFYVWDETGGEPLGDGRGEPLSADVDLSPREITPGLLMTDESLGLHARTHPEVLCAAAAVLENA